MSWPFDVSATVLIVVAVVSAAMWIAHLRGESGLGEPDQGRREGDDDATPAGDRLRSAEATLSSPAPAGGGSRKRVRTATPGARLRRSWPTSARAVMSPSVASASIPTARRRGTRS